MLKALKRALGAALIEEPVPAQERRQLQLAVAILVHEARRADYAEGNARESDAGVSAFCDIFSLERAQAAELLAQGREKAQHLTSFYARKDHQAKTITCARSRICSASRTPTACSRATAPGEGLR